jgi:hypothetical protein
MVKNLFSWAKTVRTVPHYYITILWAKYQEKSTKPRHGKINKFLKYPCAF